MQFKSIFDFFCFYLFITLAFNPLLKPYSYFSLNQAESICKSNNCNYRKCYLLILCTIKKKKGFLFKYIRLSNSKFDKHSMH